MLAIRQKSQEPSFSEAIDFFCFISICKFGSFKTPFSGITSLPELYIGLIDSVGINKKSDFYEIWKQHKQLEIMEMSDTSPNIYNEEHINQFQPEHTHKSH